MHPLMQLEKFSRDSFRVKRTYVDLAGDLVSGILLGQIVFWFTPNEEGKSKLRVFKDGLWWLAKGRGDWWDEIRISEKQFDRAIRILEEKGLVELRKYKFNGSPMIHIHLLIDKVFEGVNSILTDGEKPTGQGIENPISTDGEIGSSPKGKIQFTEKGNSLTEITTETTSDIPVGEQQAAPDLTNQNVPDLQKAVAITFLAIGKKEKLSEDDMICLNMLFKIHTPAAIQTQILKSFERLKKNGSVTVNYEGKDYIIKEAHKLPVRYIWNSMQGWSSLRNAGGGKNNGKSRANPNRKDKDYAGEDSDLFAK